MDTYSEIESEIKNRVVKIISNGWIIQCECFKVSNKTKKLGEKYTIFTNFNCLTYKTAYSTF